MIFIVSIDNNFSPLQVEKLRHEILNLRGVVSAEWQEAAQQSVQRTADGLCPECGKLGGSHLWSCKIGDRRR